MGCYPDTQIQEYLAGELSNLEGNRIRDHLLTCRKCSEIADRYRKMEPFLQTPRLSEPPETIMENVLKRLYPQYPVYSSIAALIAASIVFLVTWIYIYFDFANNSLIKALHMTSRSTSNWLIGTLRSIDTLFSIIYASFKAISHVLQSILHVSIDPRVIGGIILTLSLTFFYLLFHLFARRLKESDK